MVAAAQISGTAKRALQAAKPAPFPGFVEFAHPEPRPRPPSGPGWLHEIKVHGYRAQLLIQAGMITARSAKRHTLQLGRRNVDHQPVEARSSSGGS
jgi:ATP-dependent DNA ligase